MIPAMRIHTATFVKGIVGPDKSLKSPLPQLAFIGRSNVGKSTLINTLTNNKNLARTSAFPGRTQEINLFLINDTHHLLDLPGYGFAKLSLSDREQLQDRIDWYLFRSEHQPKWVVLIMDAQVGPTTDDMAMYQALKEHGHPVLIIANKVDKLKSAKRAEGLRRFQTAFVDTIIPFSSETKVGSKELVSVLLS